MRAARLRARTIQLAQQAALGLAALDALPQAIALVDAHCRIQHCNAAADRLLCTPGAMHVRHGRLQCDESAAQARWQCIVAAACMRQGTGMAGTLMAKSGTRGLVVTVLPIHAHHPAAFIETPLALVVLHDPDAPQGMDPRLIADMLGLSPTETRLALMIASGKTIKDFAAAEGVSWHTARTHIKNLLRKTGCRRQMEIAALLRSLRMGGCQFRDGRLADLRVERCVGAGHRISRRPGCSKGSRSSEAGTLSGSTLLGLLGRLAWRRRPV